MIDWAPYDHLIKTRAMSNAQIARMAGASHTAVQKRRKRLAALAERNRLALDSGETELKNFDQTKIIVSVERRTSRPYDSDEPPTEEEGVVLVAHDGNATYRFVERAALAAVFGAGESVRKKRGVWPAAVDATHDYRATDFWLRRLDAEDVFIV